MTGINVTCTTEYKIYIKTVFIQKKLNKYFTIHYFTLHKRLITWWLVAKQARLTATFVNVMGITLGMIAMAFDKFLIYFKIYF